MKRRNLTVLGLAALAMLPASCQLEERGANVTGEVEFTLNAGIPAELTTYADGNAAFSHRGGANNVNPADYDLRYTLEVYDGDQLAYEAVQVVSQDFTTTSVQFKARLLAKQYRFVLWADFVGNGSTPESVYDLYYNTENLRAISYTDAVKDSPAMLLDDAADAYYKALDVNLTETGQSITDVKLQRPFGKMRFIATDELTNPTGQTERPAKVTLNFGGSEVPTTFNADNGVVGTEDLLTLETLEFTAKQEDASVNNQTETKEGAYLLGNAYFFPTVPESAYPVKVTVYSEPGNQIGYRDLSGIPVQPNKLTTVIGNFYSNEGSIDVKVDDMFDGDEDVENVPDPVEVSTVADLQKALDEAEDGDVIVIAPGTYDGNFSLKEAVNSGTAKTITIEGANAGVKPAGMSRSSEQKETVITGSLFSEKLSTDQVYPDLKVIIDGVTFQGGGVKVADMSYNAIGDLTIKNCKFIPAGEENNYLIATNHNARENCRSTIRLYDNYIGNTETVNPSYYLVRLWAVKHIEVIGNTFAVNAGFNGLQHLNISNLSGSGDASVIVRDNVFINGPAGVNISSWKVGEAPWADSMFLGTVEVTGNTFRNVAAEGTGTSRNQVPVFVSPEYQENGERVADHGHFFAQIRVEGNTYDGYTAKENVIDNLQGTIISTVAEFQEFARKVNSGEDSFQGKVVRLANDIFLDPVEWIPVGISADNDFQGVFDGAGHTIHNLSVQVLDNTAAPAGLFGVVSGTVRNFMVDGAYIDHTVDIKEGQNNGGIAVVVGYLRPNGSVENVTVRNATVFGNRWTGGIVGYTIYDGTSFASIRNCTVENSSFTATPDQLTGSYDNGDKVGGIVGVSLNGRDVITDNAVTSITLYGYRDLGGVAGAAYATSLKNNRASGIKITVDQKTGYYGMKDANAGYVLGRNLGKGSLDASNVASGENRTEYIYFVENGTDLATLGSRTKSNTTFYVQAGEYDSFGLYTYGRENVALIAEGEVIVNGKLTFGTHSNYTRAIPESTTIEGFTVKGELFLGACGKLVARNNKAAQLTVKTHGLTGNPAYPSDIELTGNTLDGTLGVAPQKYAVYIVPNVTGYKLNVTDNTIRNVGSHALCIQGCGDGSAKTTPAEYRIAGNKFESWGLGNAENRGAVKVWADTAIAPENLEGKTLDDLTEAARDFVRSVLAGNNTYPEQLAGNCVKFEFYGLGFNGLE